MPNSADVQVVEADLSELTNWTGEQSSWWFQLVENPGDGAVASEAEMFIQQILFMTESAQPDYTELLSFLASGNWRMFYEEAGYRGVGPATSYWAEWWSAEAGQDPSTHGMVDDSFAFTTDGGFSYDTGADGTITGKKPEIDANFDPTGENAYDADNGYNEYFNYPLANFTDTFEVGSDGTYETITFAQNGGTQFYTSVAPQTFQILERTETTMYLRNVGSEGNAWYMLVTNDEPPVVNCTYEVFMVDGGDWPSEISWSITDESGAVVMSGDASSASQMLEVAYGVYTLNMYDSYGDGWNGGIISIGGTEYSLEDGYDGTAEIVCEPFVCEYDVNMTAEGDWPSEISWDIMNNGGTVVLSGDATTTGATLTLTEEEVFTLTMYDSYGDGWNGGVLTIGNTEYTLEDGYDGTAEITCSPAPSMNASVTTDADSAHFSFMLQNFTVGAAGDTGVDGHIHYSLNGGDEVMVYSADDLTLADLPNGDHTIVFSLVDNSHQPLDPAVEVTLEFSTFNGILACGETTSICYGNNSDEALWFTSTADEGQTASVTFDGSVEEDYDYVIVANGAGEFLAEFTGDLTGVTVESDDGTLMVYIDSDSSISCQSSASIESLSATVSCAGLSTEDTDILDMTVYPNPVENGFVTILTPIDGEKYIEIYSVTGRKVLETTMNGNTLDVSSLTSGFYMLNVTVDGLTNTSKLVVR